MQPHHAVGLGGGEEGGEGREEGGQKTTDGHEENKLEPETFPLPQSFTFTIHSFFSFLDLFSLPPPPTEALVFPVRDSVTEERTQASKSVKLVASNSICL